jgi:hypothetical protein
MTTLAPGGSPPPPARDVYYEVVDTYGRQDPFSCSGWRFGNRIYRGVTALAIRGIYVPNVTSEQCLVLHLDTINKEYPVPTNLKFPPCFQEGDAFFPKHHVFNPPLASLRELSFALTDARGEGVSSARVASGDARVGLIVQVVCKDVLLAGE